MASKSLLLAATGLVGLGALAYVANEQGWLGQDGDMTGAGVMIDADDIGGVVIGDNGPEAGVWVIAETTDLPTKFARIVVTDDAGRFVLPDLPSANYDLWVRGYGLVDSAKIQAAPGAQLSLTSMAAPDAASAAQYYPALYWWSMLAVPNADEFPGTGDTGNGIATRVESQAHWISEVKEGCYSCHQLGNKATRELPPGLGEFDNTLDAWTRRIQSGQASASMVSNVERIGAQRSLEMFADWTDRVTGGELPVAAPERPQGIERNLVITLWDWASDKTYLHDEIATDRRNPTLNANGVIFGSAEASTDYLPVLDPVNHTISEIKVPVRYPDVPSSRDNPMFAPSPYFGDEAIWDSQVNVHNPMYDGHGRMWTASRIRTNDNPAFCKAGSDHPSARMFPLDSSPRQTAVYDPATEEWATIDLCFGTHHLVFAPDENDTLYFSVGFPGGGSVLGWLNTKLWDETKDEQLAQSWTPFILDTNANGVRDEGYAQPGEPIDPTRDARVELYPYSAVPSPADPNVVWGSSMTFPGGVVRVELGDDPVTTAKSEYFEVPFESAGGFTPRGLDVDRDGVAWLALHSGHLASFDRRMCQGTLNGPEATGKHCPEGWTLHTLPGPKFVNDEGGGSAEVPYYPWVDLFNTFGLGENVPMVMGNAADSIYALKDGELITLRVPYPIGFFAKNADGRIDDADAGWKGRGLWTTYGNRTPFHFETGVGTKPKAVKMQLRPDPLAH